MAPSNRAAVLKTTHKILKKHYKPVTPDNDRGVLEHLVYGLCLENSTHESADAGYRSLTENYFDWNEVRVSTVAELAESLSGLADPRTAASNVKRALHAIFESRFSFDLEELKKQNIGAAVKQLEVHPGVTPFALSYVTQHALGGHSIPVDEALLRVAYVLGIINEEERKKGTVPGLERAIPKSKGIEFASLIHQLAADFYAVPHSPKIRPLLLEIAPDAKSRMPKRGGQKSKSSGSSGKSSRRRTAKSKESTDGGRKTRSGGQRISRRKPR